MASTSRTLPMRVTRTARGTHVVHVRSFSRLQQQQCGFGGFVNSPPFTVADGGDGDRGHVGAFVVLLTAGEVARAYVGILLLDQTTGLADTTVVWDHLRTRFDAESAMSCARGTGKVATRSELMGSRFVRGDCLKIECVLDDVSRGHMLK